MVPTMFGLLAALFGLLRATLRSGRDLVVENLLLRQRLALLRRSTRERARLRGRDKHLWVLAASPAATSADTRPRHAWDGRPVAPPGAGDCSDAGGRAHGSGVLASTPRCGVLLLDRPVATE
jgi:hypothetical protein